MNDATPAGSPATGALSASARDDARGRITGDPRLSAIAQVAAASMGDSPDAAHDLEHCLRVAGWALRCDEGATRPEDLIAAALLHDVVNVRKDDPRRAEASALSAARAREILAEVEWPPERVDAIADAIEDHSFSRGAVPRSPLGEALQDADRLEALGALGLMRTFSTGARMNAEYFHATDPFAESRPLDDRRYSVDHFFTKLLRLPPTLRTAVGRREAGRRAAALEGFLRQLADELGRLPPAV